MRYAVLALALCACEVDGADDAHLVCSTSLDHAGDRPSWSDIDGALEHARASHTTVLFHGHRPGEVLQVATLARVLDKAAAIGLPVVTYDQLGNTPLGGLAVAIDDNAIDQWFALRDMLNSRGVHLTFFVCRWNQMPQVAIDELMQLAADGHELEPHTVNHLHAVDYVEQHGLTAYLRDEVDPSFQIMEDHGIQPHAFAYPFGERDDEIDHALLERVPLLRASGPGCE